MVGRRALWCGWMVVSMLALAAPAAAGGPTSIEFLGNATLPPETRLDGVPVGGLSGLAWDAASGDFLALSDDRSELGPARFYRLRFELANGRFGDSGLRVLAATPILGPDGRTLPRRSADPEGIAYDEGRLFVSSEGEAKVRIPPFVAELSPDGHWRRELPLPARYLPDGEERSGVRDNLAFEALTLSPDGRTLIAGLENGLAQESPKAGPGQASRSRLLLWDLESGEPPRELLYDVEGLTITPPNPSALALNGLVELTAVDGQHLLALERQFVGGVGVVLRLFAVDLAGASDVAAIDRTAGRTDLVPAAKTLLLDFSALGVPLDNFEGMTFGPVLPDGRRTLFVVSDDNFDAEAQRTIVLAFAIGFEPLGIGAVQGAGHRSPYAGRWVEGLEGVVTAIEDSEKSRGFWMESERGDGDPATSEGIYVAWEGASTLHPGERVRVGGHVEERGPASGLPVTTLAETALAPLGEGAPPPPRRLFSDLRPPAQVDDDGLADFQPGNDAIDFWEALEGMRVVVPAGAVVGPTRDFGELVLFPDGAQPQPRTLVGGLRATAAGPSLERVILGRRLTGRIAELSVGDRVGEDVVGIVDYSFSNYKVQPLAPLVAVARGRSCRDASALGSSRRFVTLGTYNVENLSAAGPGARFDGIGDVIARSMHAPAIVALEEIQDDSGAADDGTVTAKATLTRVVDAVVRSGGPRYQALVIDPENDRDGGQPGANIRVALLYDPERVEFVPRGTAGPDDAVEVLRHGHSVGLSLSPGRVAPASAAFDLRSGEGVRKSLAAEFRAGGRSLFVIANHWTSKWDDDRPFGSRQPARERTSARRLAQAGEIRAFVDRILAVDPLARVVVLGDLNDVETSEPVRKLAAPPLVNLVERVPDADRYSFNHEGTSQAIDHVVVSPILARDAQVDIVHVDADCTASLRASDHDPVVVRLRVE